MIKKKKVPNERTIRVLEESAQGTGVNTYSSVKEMFSGIYKELEEENLKLY